MLDAAVATLFSGRDVFARRVAAEGGKVSTAKGMPLLPALLRDQGFFTAAVDNVGLWIQRAFDAVREDRAMGP